MSDLLYKDECYAIQGAIFEVYREKGCGFLEAVYQECLEIEFRERNIPAVSQPLIPMSYKGVRLTQVFVPDFLLHDKIILELKAVKQIADPHRAQVMNYLKAGNFRLAMLVNFGHFPKAEIERIIL